MRIMLGQELDAEDGQGELCLRLEKDYDFLGAKPVTFDIRFAKRRFSASMGQRRNLTGAGRDEFMSLF